MLFVNQATRRCLALNATLRSIVIALLRAAVMLLLRCADAIRGSQYIMMLLRYRGEEEQA